MFPEPKSPREIKKMRKGGEILAKALIAMRDACQPGVSTLEVDNVGRKVITDAGMKCGFLGYYGFPGVACFAINDEVVHGVPSPNKILQEGDLVSIDTGVVHAKMNTDACISFGVGKIQKEEEEFLHVVKDSLFAAIGILKDGVHLGDISAIIQKTLEAGGAAVVKDLTGHGIGKNLHEKPEILNYGKPGTGPILRAGQTFAIEPIATMGGSGKIYTGDDNWTIFSTDGALAGQYECTVVVTDDGCEILTPWHEMW